MNAATKRVDPEREGTTPPAGPADADPELVSTSQRTFTGFVRTSTYAAVVIAMILIGMALFLL